MRDEGEQRQTLRVVQSNDVVEIFKDPETEEHLEGFAIVWDVFEEDDQFYHLIVCFMGDPHKRKTMRKYRKQAPEK